MMWMHPVLQMLAVLASLYVVYLGYTRFVVLHLGRKGPFQWKRHVQVGTGVMAVWMIGLGLGLFMAKTAWKSTFITGLHWQMALAMVPLAVFGYASGLVMDRNKARRTALPLAHAVNNTLLVAMALTQLATGILVLRDYVLP